MVILFSTGVLWMWIFAIVSYETGKFLDLYLEKQQIRHSFLIATMTLFALAFIIQGLLDLFALALGFTPTRELVIAIELMLGFAFAVIASILQSTFRIITEDYTLQSQG